MFMTATLVNSLEIFSIIDQYSVPSCLLKVHSVIESSLDKNGLSFKFLLMPSKNLSLELWDHSFAECFPSVRFESKLWDRPARLGPLSGAHFEKDVIFARFYLPYIFPNVHKFIYLDNDIVVTADLYDLYAQRLTVSRVIPNANIHNSPVENPRSLDRQMQRPHATRKQSPGLPATVGFVFETHPGYKDYIGAHFNNAHRLVKSALDAHGVDSFLNGGVFVVDAVRWRQKNFTRQAEQLILDNQAGYIYNTAAVGDQGPFYLMFVEETAYLHPRYNMRRQPKKTVQMLGDGQTTGR